MLKRMLLLLIALSVLLLGFSFATAQQDGAPVHVASLKGPTSMGLVQMMQADQGVGAFDFTVSGTADAIVPLLVKGEIDIALVPCNLASVLYAKMNGGVRITALNTLGVLYVVENGDTVHSIEDLAGRTLYTTGKGTTPEYALNTVLHSSGIDPSTDLTIEFISEATEVASLLGAGKADLAVLPQPYVTAVLAQNPALRLALSLNDVWTNALPDSALVTGVVLMRRDFLENNAAAAEAFMAAYRNSTAYVNEHPAEASVLIEQLGIAKAAIAEKAIPLCNIVCIEGAQMKQSASGYLQSLFTQDPASVGGALPADDFYHNAD